MPYQLITPQAVMKELEELHHKALQVGLGDQVLSAARTITQRLQDDPTNFGEPVQNLPNLNLVLWVGIASPLVVHYAINEQRQFVCLKAFLPLPGHGL